MGFTKYDLKRRLSFTAERHVHIVVHEADKSGLACGPNVDLIRVYIAAR